ncbi:MAG: hypothetical protein KBB33_02700 [Candidatus Cloacimonetes bacterium]|nr:hypothetical protein [Candidatus Cloacimonadota bacterium]HOA30072.1 hypothetical protein [Candidatus Cloacimonadota bacterium]HPI26098.1 hypothetical protein [Candidatus Cloacimonadota bacterium]
MKRFLLVLIALLAFGSLMAFEHYSTAMGLHMGTSTGKGYSVRHWSKTNGYQVTLSAYAYGSRHPDYEYYDIDGDYKNARKQTGNFAVNYLWDLQRTKAHHLYIITGGNFTLQKIKRYYKPISNGDPIVSKWVDNNKWFIGVGPGVEMKLGERFHFSVELPITLNHRDDIVMYVPAAGIYYYFD